MYKKKNKHLSYTKLINVDELILWDYLYVFNKENVLIKKKILLKYKTRTLLRKQCKYSNYVNAHLPSIIINIVCVGGTLLQAR